MRLLRQIGLEEEKLVVSGSMLDIYAPITESMTPVRTLGNLRGSRIESVIGTI
jgi:hypothetical protein